jgi:nitroimidazol reductase NimA-like FMN-containing flavoprotein (pyridoxamine 5'-phosphate oxidase superfamily)
MKKPPPSARAKVKRVPGRGRYDKKTVYSILDEGLVCYVGFIYENRPYVIPTSYARVGDRLILHGSRASRMMLVMTGGADLCVTVAHVDGLVLARSSTHHSVNYRSVVIFGKAREITGEENKTQALRDFFEFTIPGRWETVRPPSSKETSATTLVEIPLDEASAKIRAGGPDETADDADWPVWTGVIPLEMSALPPVGDDRRGDDTPPPEHASRYTRKPKK